MKKYKITIPKKILHLPFVTRLFVFLLCTVLIFIVLLSLSFVKGMSANIKNNISRNYNSHLSVFSSTYLPQTEKQLLSWWGEPLSALEQMVNQPYIRAITKRSTIPAIFSNNLQQYPIRLTVLEQNDSDVFSNFISSTTKETKIAKDRVFIGSLLAQKMNLEVGDPFPIIIPELNYKTTNLLIGYIFNSPDLFYDHYGVFVNKDTLTNIIDKKFQKYHIRFSATPFISLIEPTINPVIADQKKEYADDLLNYQYLQLNALQNNILKWGYLLYFFCGIILFLSTYLYYYTIINDINSYTYRTGFIPKLNLHFKVLFKAFTQLCAVNIFAFALLLLFLWLKINIPSYLFTSNNALYSQLSLPITYTLQADLPAFLLQWFIPLGIVIGIIAYGIMMVTYHILPNFLSSSNKKSYIIVGMFFIIVLGFFTAYEYAYYRFANKARETFWTQYFFGKYTLTEKNYHHYLSLSLSPSTFPIPMDLLTILQENNINYMTSLETSGQISIITNTPTEGIDPIYLTKDISIKALQGNLTQFSNILAPLQSNQVVIGKEVADYFLSNRVLTLSLYNIIDNITDSINTNNADNTNTNNIDNINTSSPISQTSVIVSHIVDIPFGDFNNTVFLNQTNLSSLLTSNPLNISKLQVSGGRKYLSLHTNDQIILNNLYDNTKYWQKASNLVLYSYFISSFLQAFIGIFFIFSIQFFLYIYNRDKLINFYVWGILYTPSTKYSLLTLVSFIIGMMVAWVSQIPFLIKQNNIPAFLQINTLTPNKYPFSIDWIAIPLLSLGVVISYIIVYYIFRMLLKCTQQNLVRYSFKDDYS